MSNEFEQRPRATKAIEDDGAEVEILRDPVDVYQAPPLGRAPVWREVPDEDIARAPRKRLRLVGMGAITVGAIALTVVLLAQGLTAALRTSWPMRVAGESDTPDIRLSVETNIPQAKRSSN